ncbi:MAG TPA: restriction endonuclease subunit S [Edaphocola sp.]|nr:restriction endonuclease subunit S [Edaphocola sp.]
MKVAENNTLSLPKGYKKIEVGLIPEDWEVKAIGEIFTFYSTSNFSKAEMTLDGEVGCVHYGLIHAIDNTSFSLRNGVKFYVTKEQAKYESLQNGDVVMVDASEDLVGLNKSVEVSGITDKEYIAGLHTFHLRDKNSTYINSFRGLVLNSDSVKKQMLRVAVGMKVFGVSKPQLQQILVPVPTKAEQAAIATALSDADALISSLEKLIAKKRMIKQGAMQKLLQPKEGWEVKKLGEIGTIVTGSTPPTQIKEYWNGSIPWITPTDITINQKDIFHSEREITNAGLQAIRKLPANTLLVTCIASIGKNAILRIEGACNQQINAIIPNAGYSVDYLYFLIENSKSYIIGKAGITATMMISKNEFSEIVYAFPDFNEQTRIATILSDMDAEIDALETKLEKYRKVKLGMMQNLLTGKIRLNQDLQDSGIDRIKNEVV